MEHSDYFRDQAAFPPTRGSLLLALRTGDSNERQRALDALLSVYWKPVYKYIRLKWSKNAAAAEDLTQEFFAEVIERNLLDRYDPEKAKLRTYLRLCVDGLAANEYKASQRLKRGGGAQWIPLDFVSAEGEVHELEIPAPGSEDEFFAREWARSIFEVSLTRLQQQCQACGKDIHFKLLELYDVDEGGKEMTYQDAAHRFGIKPTDVTNYLAYARRQFRKVVLQQIRLMTANDEEYRREARALLGVEPS